MKNLKLWLCVGSLSLISACASPYAPLPPVGPAPTASAYTASGPGTLVVYSAASCFNNLYTFDHSGYMVYGNDGKLVKWVPNFIEGDLTVEPPTRVHLPAGSYKVKAEGGRYGWVVVPVVIKNGQTTPLYLDGERHSLDALANQNNTVRLPDGEIIGWAAHPVGNEIGSAH